MKPDPPSAASPAPRFPSILVLTVALGAAGWWLGGRFPSAPVTTAQAPSASSGSASASASTKPQNVDANADAKSAGQESTGENSASLDAELLQLLKLTPAEWPDRLRRAFLQGNQDEIKWLAERWAARNPASLLAFMQSADGLGFRIDYWPDWTITQACFGAWFRKNMAGAMAAMERLTQFEPGTGRTSHGVWQVIFPTLMRSDPGRALQFLTDHPSFTASAMMSSAEYRNLAPLAANLPDCAGRKGLLSAIFEAFRNDSDPEKGREAGLAWLAKLDPARRIEAMPDLRETDAAAADKTRELLRQAFTIADLDTLDQKTAGGAPEPARIRQLAQLRALLDPQAAMTWATGLKGLDKLAAMGGIVENSAPDKPAEATAFLENIPAGPLHDHARKIMTGNLASKGGAQAAADWLISLPDARDAKNGITQLVSNWALNQPKDCAAWVGTLAPGPLRLGAASELLDSSRDDTAKLTLAASLPADLGLEALHDSWGTKVRGDSRPIAEAAAQQPPGPIREAAMAKAAGDARVVFNGYNQAWLDWASALPTPADRAAAWRGAEMRGDTSIWGEGIREKAKQQLSGEAQ